MLLFLLKWFIYLRIRVRTHTQTQIKTALHFGHDGLGWSRPNPGVGSFIYTSHVVYRGSNTWAIVHHFPRILAGSWTGSGAPRVRTRFCMQWQHCRCRGNPHSKRPAPVCFILKLIISITHRRSLELGRTSKILSHLRRFYYCQHKGIIRDWQEFQSCSSVYVCI